MATDLEQLIDMGFDPEKSKMAMKKSGNLADAVDWLGNNADKSIEELNEEDTAAAESSVALPAADAKSLVCNECGQKFKSHAAATAHAERTEHTDFAESTDEIAPLTEEQKKQKLAELKERAAARKAGLSEQEKLDRKRNEEIGRKKTKESQDIKEQMLVKEQIKDAEKKRQEKLDEVNAKKKIQAKIAADKEDRRRKMEDEKAMRAGVALPNQPATAAPPAAAPTVSKPASSYTETRLRLQTATGSIVKTFPVTTTLFEVAQAVGDEIGRDIESFTQNFPKKVFDREYFGESLKDLKLVPSASLIVT